MTMCILLVSSEKLEYVDHCDKLLRITAMCMPQISLRLSDQGMTTEVEIYYTSESQMTQHALSSISIACTDETSTAYIPSQML